MRTPVIAGNWKMFKTPAQTREFFSAFLPLVEGSSHCEIVVCPSYLSLAAAVEAVAGSRVRVGAQNIAWAKEGAFTGEVSGPMLVDIGVQAAIVGHSERRQHCGETDATVLQRTQAALEAGLQPIVCVGEMLEEREGGRTEEVLRAQFQDGLAPLTPEQFGSVVIAYEPVWAIGTGKTATPEIAQDAHAFLRSLIAAAFGESAAQATRILYGGSVKPDNVQGLMAQPDIDGALVGGASLEAGSFAKLVNYDG